MPYWGGGGYLTMLDPVTAAWINAVILNGGSVSEARKLLVDALVVGLRADGIFSLLDRLWLFAAENAPSALTDIITHSLATAVSTPTFTTDRGYTGNGTTSYINTNYNPNTGPQFTLNSAHGGVYTRTQPGITSRALFAINNAGGTETSLTVQTTPTETMQINSSSASSNAAQVAGMQLITRTGSSASVMYNNGTAIATDNTSTSTVIPSLSMPVLARLVAPSTVDRFCDIQAAAACFGAGLNATQQNNLQLRINTYMTTVGASVY